MLAFQFLLFRFLPCSWFGFCVSYLLQVFSAMSVGLFALYICYPFQFLRELAERRGNVGTVINPEFRAWQRTWIACVSVPPLPMLPTRV